MNEHRFKQKGMGRRAKRKEKSLNAVELRLIAELMKNSRRSDRELAKVVGVSQPTATRLRTRLQKEGYIREYTMIPDFAKLGYGIMATLLLEQQEPTSTEKLKEIYGATAKIEKTTPYSALLAVNCTGLRKNRVVIAFYRNFSDYVNAMRITKELPFVTLGSIDGYLTDLKDKRNYRVLSMSAIAEDILQLAKGEEMQ